MFDWKNVDEFVSRYFLEHGTPRTEEEFDVALKATIEHFRDVVQKCVMGEIEMRGGKEIVNPFVYGDKHV